VLARYTRWLHTRWPAGRVERLPIVGEDGATNVPGVRIAGDLTGIPLLKLAIDGGVRTARAFARELELERGGERGAERGGGAILDVVIVGGGVSGIAAAIEARALGLSLEVLESARPFETIHGFPAGKPIFTYPAQLVPAGAMKVAADRKEPLAEELEAQRVAHGIEPTIARVTHVSRGRGGALEVHVEGRSEPVRARRVLVAIGRSGDHRRLGVPGEDGELVRTRLFDPADHRGERVIVVGGGDSACETAIAIARASGHVILIHRGADLARAKGENADEVARLVARGAIELQLRARVTAIDATSVRVVTDGGEERTIDRVDRVLPMIGREPPLAFLRRSGIAIRNEWGARRGIALVVPLAIATFVYLWKLGGPLTATFEARGWFPFGLAESLALRGALAVSLEEPGFWYSLAYCAAIVGFGVARVRRRRTPYVAWQTAALAAIQIVPLFLLPYLVLPMLGGAGAFDHGAGRAIADALFPSVEYGHGREYWRAFGLVLAWPLFVWNVFTERPLAVWLAISALQTLVLVPLLIRRWGKGAYCGWICSCGALAETMGDAHREKMPHGPWWNRLNMLGQALLGISIAMLIARVIGWLAPGTAIGDGSTRFFRAALNRFEILGVPIDWHHVVDLVLAGILGVGLYFAMSGRTWCRFACPLAALMHVYQRAFGLFRIFAEKKRCISCNRCTTVCHQGIDVMAFAQRGAPMEDPQCVRCSACVEACPTGVLQFGRYTPDRSGVVLDRVGASPVRMREDGRTGLRVLP
jgi:NosR/NirI family nitrous oxide reductase transcriptional regulator